MYTKFRPWKQTKSPLAAGPISEPLASSCDQIATPRETPAPPALQFINTAHPREATSAMAIGAIRSHVAKEVHATRRFKKKGSHAPHRAQAHRRETAGPRGSTETTSVGCAARVDAENSASQQPGPGIPNTTSLLVPARRNPFNRLAKPLNDVECFLIDYCMFATDTSDSHPLSHKTSQRTLENSRVSDKLVIIPQTFSNVDNEAAKMLSLWVPFVLSDSGLLSAVLLVTCQCLLLLETHSDRGSPYARLAVEYKGACIRSIMSALSQEDIVLSDFTLAKVMVMCSYELKFGDYDNARCHARAIGRMIELKGGLHNISTQDFVAQIITRSWDLLAMTTDCNGDPLMDPSTTHGQYSGGLERST